MTDTEVLNDSIIWSLNKSGIYDRHRGLTSQDQVIPHIKVVDNLGSCDNTQGG